VRLTCDKAFSRAVFDSTYTYQPVDPINFPGLPTFNRFLTHEWTRGKCIRNHDKLQGPKQSVPKNVRLTDKRTNSTFEDDSLGNKQLNAPPWSNFLAGASSFIAGRILMTRSAFVSCGAAGKIVLGGGDLNLFRSTGLSVTLGEHSSSPEEEVGNYKYSCRLRRLI